MAFEFSLRSRFVLLVRLKATWDTCRSSSWSCRIDKTILAMNHKMIPPSLGFEKLNL
jgi:hypothetical protein